MARHRFPQDRSAFVYERPMAPILMPTRTPLEVFANEALTVLADITDIDGGAIPTSTIVIGVDGLLPEFLGPDGATRLFVRPEDSVEGYPVDAQFGPRVAVLETAQSAGDARYELAGVAAVALTAHTDAVDPHPQYQTQAEGDARYPLKAAVTAAIATHEQAADPHPQYETGAEVDAKLAAHTAAGDPHPQYLTQGEGDVRYDAKNAASAAIQAHEALVDPHTQYITQPELDAAVAGATGAVDSVNSKTGVVVLVPGDIGADPAGAATSAVSGHVAATDPHTQYLNQTRGDARYTKPSEVLTTVDARVAAHTAAVDPHGDRADAASRFMPLAQKGAAGGVATLDVGGKIPSAQLPPIAIVDSYPVASQAQMLALPAQQGDIAIRSDVGKNFILKSGGNPTVLADWLELAAPVGGVSSVDGQTGAVTLAADGAAGTATKRTLGTGATQAAAGNDPRLFDARTPLAHAASHASGGTDAITPAAIGAAKATGQVTTLNDSDSQTLLSADLLDDGSDTSTWPDRVSFKFGSKLVAWLNEYFELRLRPAKANTVALRIFRKDVPADPARDMSVPLFEVLDDRTNRNRLMAVHSDGHVEAPGHVHTTVLAVGDPIPPGTPTGLVIRK